MAPLLHFIELAVVVDERDSLLVYRRYDTPQHPLANGSVVAFEIPMQSTQWGRVLAGPGDTIESDGVRFYVNGLPGPTHGDPARKPVVAVPLRPNPYTVIPQGHYFMSHDQFGSGIDSRVLGLIPQDTIVTSELRRLKWTTVLEPIP